MRHELTRLVSNQASLQTSQMQMQTVIETMNTGITALLSVNGVFAGAEPKDVQTLEKHSDNLADDFVAQEKMDCQAGLIRSQGSMVLIPTMDEEMFMLKSMFEQTEVAEEEAEHREALRRNRLRYMIETMGTMTRPQWEVTMDTVVGGIICLNALFIGVSMDYGQSTIGWFLADSVFTVIFIIEISAKIRINGFGGHFCGRARYSNCFDAFLVFIDLLQLSLMVIAPDAAKNTGDLPSASLFRVVRLIKLTRLLRLLRNEVFKDLLSMIQGLMGGLTTLAWSMVLFLLMVYILALLFRELLGRKEKENVFEFFDSVPRSMFTTFRCSFGDCSTAGGVPIFEYVHKEYGWPVTLFYCLFVFIVTIGLFNVISAIFVESTMVAAMALENSRKKARLQDEKLWNTRITTLVKRIMAVSHDHDVPERMSDAVAEIHSISVDRDVIDRVVHDAAAIQALNDLDIDPEDHAHLSDILDPDNGGTIEICELIEGLRRLRGDPRRSDIVCCDLMIRALQKAVSDIKLKVNEVHEAVTSRRE